MLPRRMGLLTAVMVVKEAVGVALAHVTIFVRVVAARAEELALIHVVAVATSLALTSNGRG